MHLFKKKVRFQCVRISSGVIQNNSDNPPNLAGTDSNAKGMRGEGEKLKLWRLLSWIWSEVRRLSRIPSRGTCASGVCALLLR